MATEQQVDFLIVGAGIAGASAAAELAAVADVVMLEMEPQPGYHSTGRSAAFYAPAYGNAVVRGLTRASDSFFRNPPDGFAEVPLIRPRGCLFVAREDQLALLAETENEIQGLTRLDESEARRLVPILKPGYARAALEDNRGGDMDVDAILQGYLRLFRRRGGTLLKNHRVRELRYVDDRWLVTAGDRILSAPVVLNAAGAWADEVASSAGVGPVGLTPKRRTALLVAAPEGAQIENWPIVVDAEESFYFKPDAGQLLISPADETPTDPCDAQAEEWDIAVAVDRFMQATDVDVKRVAHHWAGLRTFAPDKTFVVGFDPRHQGFFWLAGQGGYGMQSAPGIAKLVKHLITGQAPDPGFDAVLNYVADVAPQRLIEGGQG